MKKHIEMNLTQLSLEVHDKNKEKGFYEEHEKIIKFLEDTNAPEDLKSSYIKAFIDQRLALVTTEVSEAVESNRKNKHAIKPVNIEGWTEEYCREESRYFNQEFEVSIKDSFEDELADTLIRVLDLAGYLNIDIQYHVDMKLLYNSLRPRKHNKNY